MNEKDKNRAYELLKRLYDNNFIVTDSFVNEVEEIFEPKWIKNIEENNGFIE